MRRRCVVLEPPGRREGRGEGEGRRSAAWLRARGAGRKGRNCVNWSIKWATNSSAILRERLPELAGGSCVRVRVRGGPVGQRSVLTALGKARGTLRVRDLHGVRAARAAVSSSRGGRGERSTNLAISGSAARAGKYLNRTAATCGLVRRARRYLSSPSFWCGRRASGSPRNFPAAICCTYFRPRPRRAQAKIPSLAAPPSSSTRRARYTMT